MRRLGVLVLVLAMGTVTASCSSANDGEAGDAEPRAQASTGAPVAAVVDEVVAALTADGASQLEMSRALAYVSLAGAQAVALDAPQALAFTELSGYPVPSPIFGTVDGAVSAVVAMSATARSFLAPASVGAVDDLERKLLDARERAVDPDEAERSREWGAAVAAGMVAWSASDGYATRSDAWVPPVGPGRWEPTPPTWAAAEEPGWGALRPFVALAGQCVGIQPRTPQPPPGADPVAEVVDVGESAGRRARAAAEFWADAAPGTPPPAGHWALLASRQIRSRGFDANEAARLQAMLTTAVADAYLLVWREKFARADARPVTRVREAGDSEWLPLLDTPPSPESPSGHATVAPAAATVLAGAIGPETPVRDPGAARMIGAPASVPPQSFASAEAAARDAARSRVVGGVSFDATVQESYGLGRCIGRTVMERLGGVPDPIDDAWR